MKRRAIPLHLVALTAAIALLGPTASAPAADRPGEFAFTRLSTLHGGAWSFYGDPRAVRAGRHIFSGWIGKRGLIQVADFDVVSGHRVVVSLGPSLGRVDDHNNPSLVLRRDGRLIVFYSPHSGRYLPKKGVSHLYYRTSRHPRSVRSWGPVRRIPTNSAGRLGYTYPNPVDLGGGRIWLAWRGGNWQPTAAVTHDYGGSWSRARSFLRSSGKQRPYAKYAAGPHGSVLIAYNQDNSGKSGSGLYFMQYRPGSGYFRAGGSRIARDGAVMRTSRGDRVVSRSSYGRLFIRDVAAGADGRPIVLYEGKKTHQPPTLFYAHWSGAHWEIERIASAGFVISNRKLRPRDYGQYPTAGAALDHDEPTTVYYSRQIDVGGGRKQLVVERWTRSVNGHWRSLQISPSDKSCVRPADVRGDESGAVVMMCGRYRSWINFNTAIYVATPTTR